VHLYHLVLTAGLYGKNKAKTAVSVALEAKPEVEIWRQPQKSTFWPWFPIHSFRQLFARTYHFTTTQNVIDDRQTTQCTKGMTDSTVSQKLTETLTLTLTLNLTLNPIYYHDKICISSSAHLHRSANQAISNQQIVSSLLNRSAHVAMNGALPYSSYTS